MENFNNLKLVIYLKEYKWNLFISILVILYFIPIIVYSNDFPFFNTDYQIILDFLVQYKLSATFDEKLRLIFVQHNEHRVIFTKLIALFDYATFGEINFKRIIFIGNLGLPISLFYLYKSVFTSNKIQKFVVLSIFLLNFSFWEISFWPSASLQLVWVYTFFIITLYRLKTAEKDVDILYSLAFAIITTFTSGNGFLVFLVGNLVLFYSLNNKIRWMVIWNFTGITVCILYYLTFEQKSDLHSVFHIFSYAKQNLIYFFIIMLGSGIDIPNKLFALFLGQILLMLIIYLGYKKYFVKNTIISSVIVFLMCSIAICSIVRFELGEDTAMYSRYKFFSSLLFGFVTYAYLELYLSTKNNHLISKLYPFFLVLLSYFNYTHYSNKIYFEFRNTYYTDNKLMASVGSVDPDFHYNWSEIDKSYPKNTLLNAHKLGIYQSEFSTTINPLNQHDFDDTSKVKSSIEYFGEIDSAIVCYGWALRKNLSSEKSRVFFIVKDSVDRICMNKPAIRTQRNYLETTFKAIKPISYILAGFHIHIPKNDIPSGKYRIEIYLSDGYTKSRLNSKKQLQFTILKKELNSK